MRLVRSFRYVMLLCAFLGSVSVVGHGSLAEGAEKDRPSSDKDAEQWVPLPYMVTKGDLERLFAVPPIRTEQGFAFSVLVPPGHQLYDPFDVYIMDKKTFLVADDGASGHIWKVTTDVVVTSLAAPARYSPYTLDVAPPSFGKFTGQIYALAFNEP